MIAAAVQFDWNMHILVVEDDAAFGEALTEIIQEYGHQVTLATNAPNALRVLATMQPDVVLIDIGLPVFDGNFLAGEIRRRPAPIRAWSGSRGAAPRCSPRCSMTWS